MSRPAPARFTGLLQGSILLDMLVNLDKASFIVRSGSKLLLHFEDTSVHMRSFESRRALNGILDAWEVETRRLRGESLADCANRRKSSCDWAG
jgi:hypothetical protein